MKKKHLYRVHYVLGFRQLTFSKYLPEKPFYELRIIDSNYDLGYDLDIQLGKESGNISTAFYYNVVKGIFETEVRVKNQLPNVIEVDNLIKAFTACSWKCETIKQDIEDLKTFIESKH